MKDTKRRFEHFMFYNHEGISHHLEKMAEKGWLLSKISTFGWIYKRIEPKKLHFSVTYYPKASEFDAVPTDGEVLFQEFCEHSGWKLVLTSAQMQIFCSDEENPTPIQTEPKLEVEAIHVAAKKAFIFPYILLLVAALLQAARVIDLAVNHPIDTLSNSAELFLIVTIPMVLCICLAELIVYFVWHRKAKKMAEQGILLKTPDTTKLRQLIVIPPLLCAIYWFLNFVVFGKTLERVVTISFIAFLFVSVFLLNVIKLKCKRWTLSREVNRTITIFSVVLFMFLDIGIATFGVITMQRTGMIKSDEKEIPLEISALFDEDLGEYTNTNIGNESFFLEKYSIYQYPQYDLSNSEELPRINYTYVNVKAPFLYDTCKKEFLEGEAYWKELNNVYRKTDAKPWSASEVYRLYYDENESTNQYLLCYNKYIVEIQFDFEPTALQMKYIGEIFKK